MSEGSGAPDNTSSQSQNGSGDYEAAAERLRQQVRAHLAAVVASSDDAIISKTLDSIVRTWNAGAERIFGYTAEEMIGQPIQRMFPPDRVDEEIQIVARLRAGERVDHFETVRVRKDGTPIDVSVTISPIRDENGKIIGASKIARDITQQKQIQRELQLAKEEAESASRAKDQFLSLLSHELRTPLTPVLASLSYLEDLAELPADLREELGMIRRNVETEARLVDDLLDLTRINRGKMELHFETVDAHGAITNTVAMFRHDSAAKKVSIVTELNAPEYHVWADPGRLQQILVNLLSNAIKFTPVGGRVMIRTELRANRRLRIEVSDTGIGIAPELIPQLFQPFQQGERTRTRQYGGLGLGLSIVRSLMQMHNGTASVRSEGLNHGSTFTIEFEALVNEGREQTRQIKMIGGGEGQRVLLVEDHEDTRRVMTRLLTAFGCSVVAAPNMAQALELAGHDKFDLLIADIGLPDGSGVELMERIKPLQPDIRGVAVSGFGQPEDVKASQDAGFDAHLVKPINFQRLLQVLEQLKLAS